MKYYAGIGSRETPHEVKEEMYRISKTLALAGYTLRSGGAIGADKIFARGAEESHVDEGSPRPRIYRPSNVTFEAVAMASEYHPAWDRCNAFARKLHGRNCMIVLGDKLDTPVDFIVCWTEGGKITGGTGQALRMAKKLGITVHNLAINKFQLPLKENSE